jgi:hypothetical protein
MECPWVSYSIGVGPEDRTGAALREPLSSRQDAKITKFLQTNYAIEQALYF